MTAFYDRLRYQCRVNSAFSNSIRRRSGASDPKMPLDGKYDFSRGKYDKQRKDFKDRRLKDGPNIDELIMVCQSTSHLVLCLMAC